MGVGVGVVVDVGVCVDVGLGPCWVPVCPAADAALSAERERAVPEPPGGPEPGGSSPVAWRQGLAWAEGEAWGRGPPWTPPGSAAHAQAVRVRERAPDAAPEGGAGELPCGSGRNWFLEFLVLRFCPGFVSSCLGQTCWTCLRLAALQASGAAAAAERGPPPPAPGPDLTVQGARSPSLGLRVWGGRGSEGEGEEGRF